MTGAAVSRVRRVAVRGTAVLVATTVLSACGSWKGIQNVPVPGGPGSTGAGYTLYVQMPDTLALNVNSPVRVADVNVGTVRSIQLKNWVATLTIDMQNGVEVPKNVLAKIGQTSLLGSQHLELDNPPQPAAQSLQNGDTIPLQNSSAFPTTERTLASIGMVLNGGGIPNLEIITNEVSNLLTGNADQVRELLGRLDTFTAGLNEQRTEIARAIDSTNNLISYVANRSSTLDRLLTELPPAVKQLADMRDKIANAVTAVGGISKVTARTFDASRADFDQVLRSLQRPLKQLSKSSPLVIGALKTLLTLPFPIDNVPKLIRGDYLNTSLTLDLTLSSLDNGLLTGTGFSGALRALEQSYGRDPNTMIPDVRFTPNPSQLPPERGE